MTLDDQLYHQLYDEEKEIKQYNQSTESFGNYISPDELWEDPNYLHPE